MQHRLNAYKDGYKWVIFCEICGQEESHISTACSGKFVHALIKNENLLLDKMNDAD
jgi:hypothetical protein